MSLRPPRPGQPGFKEWMDLADAVDAAGVLGGAAHRPRIDANDLERMAKDHPNERFLKGSGVLKLIGGIRMLEGQLSVAVALLNECAGPLEVSAAVIEDEDGGEAIETLIERVKAFCAASYLNSAALVIELQRIEIERLSRALDDATAGVPGTSKGQG